VAGITTTLKKIYREVWSKKRGAAQATFTGNTVDHFIDDVPVKEKEYAAKIAEIAGDEAAFKLLTSPTVFPSLPCRNSARSLWNMRRYHGREVIGSDITLAGLNDILGNHL
jgi:hypothetical protein